MNEVMTNTRELIILWKLVIFRLLCACILTFTSYYLGAMGNQSWASLDGDSKFKFCLGLLAAEVGVIAAFVDKTTSRVAAGKFTPPGVDDTQIITRSETQLSTVSSTPTTVTKTDSTIVIEPKQPVVTDTPTTT